MPKKNTVKSYLQNGFYHVYNRGVDKRKIFMDDQDYRAFLHLLKFYLSPQPEVQNTHPLSSVTGFNPVRMRNLQALPTEIDLLGYCLMPNHFHLLLKQTTQDGVTKLLRRLSTTYSMYFNRRNKRVGHLFEGIYKAILVENESYFLHLSRYIHLNPLELTGINLVNIAHYPYSSYAYYLGSKKAPWLKTDTVLSFFKTAQKFSLKDTLSYQSFVEDYPSDVKEIVGEFILEG